MSRKDYRPTPAGRVEAERDGDRWTLVFVREEESDELEELEHTLGRVHELTETNPMLGTRGVRLAVLQPDVYDMQMRAIVRAAKAVGEETGEAPVLEIMVPLVAYEQELEQMRERLERVAA